MVENPALAVFGTCYCLRDFLLLGELVRFLAVARSTGNMEMMLQAKAETEKMKDDVCNSFGANSCL